MAGLGCRTTVKAEFSSFAAAKAEFGSFATKVNDLNLVDM
jgi:hypothetical protein